MATPRVDPAILEQVGRPGRGRRDRQQHEGQRRTTAPPQRRAAPPLREAHLGRRHDAAGEEVRRSRRRRRLNGTYRPRRQHPVGQNVGDGEDGRRARPATASGDERDRYVDFIRAFSLLVVVAWHWVFTIIVWEDDGPHASNPIGFTTGLWLATWLFQVMPLFFYVGGYGHLRSWQRAQRRGESIWQLVGRRLQRLAIPALALARRVDRDRRRAQRAVRRPRGSAAPSSSSSARCGSSPSTSCWCCCCR